MKMSPVVVRKFAKRKLLWALTLVVVVFSVNVSASEEITTPSESETQTEALTTQNPADKRSDNEGDTLEHRMLGDDINISLELPESHRLVIKGEVSPSGRSGGGKGPDPTEATAKAEESKPAPTFTRWKYKPSFRHGGSRKPKTHDKDMKASSSNKIDTVERERSDYPDDFFGPQPAPNGIGKKHEESKLTPANDRAYGKFGRLWKKRPFIPLLKQTTIVRPLHDHGHGHGHGHGPGHGRGWGWRRQRHGRRHHGRGRHPRFRHQRPKRLRHGKRPLHHHGHGHGHGWGHRESKQVHHGGSKYQGWESNDIEHHSPSSMPSYAPAYISYGPFFKLPPGIKLENPVYVAPATAASQSQQYHNHKFPGLKHMDTPLLDGPKKPFGFNDHFEGDHSPHDHPIHDHSPHDHSHHDHSHHDHPPHHHPDDIPPHHHDHSHHHHHHSPNSIDHHSHHHENHEHFTHNHHKKRRPPLNKHIQFRRPSPPEREPEHHHHHEDLRPAPHHHHEDSPHNHHAHHSHETPAYHDEQNHEHHHHHHHPHENDYSNNHQSHKHQHENHHSHHPLDTPSIPNPGFSDSPPPSFYNRDNSFNNEGPLSQHHDSPNLPGYGTPEAAKNYEPPMNFGHPMHNFGPPMSSFGQPPPTFGPPSPPDHSPDSMRDGYLPGLPKDIIVGKPPGFNSHPSSHQEQQNHLHGSAPNKEFLPQNFFDTPNKHLESSSNSFDNKGGQRPGEILNQNNNHNRHPPKMSGIREEDKYYYNHDSDRGHKSTPLPPLIAYEENNPFNGKEFDFIPSKSIDPFPPRAPQRPPPRFNTNYNSPGMSKDNKVTDWFHFAKRNRQEKILMGYPLEEKRKSTKFSTLPEPFRPFNPDPRHRHIPKLTYDNMSKRVAYRRRPGAGKRPRHRDLLTKDTEDVPLNSNPSSDDEQQEQPEQQQNDLNPHEEEFNNVVNAETEIAETHSADGEEPMTLKSERGFQEMIKAHMKMME